jgi:mono/diheme cytochrome c family protein
MRIRERNSLRHGSDVWLIVAAALVLVPGCMTIDELAPPVDQILAGGGEDDGLRASTLERGRRIYLTKCVACHSPEPINRYALDRWPAIITDMAERSRLVGSEEDDVRAYVEAAWRWVQPPTEQSAVAGSTS